MNKSVFSNIRNIKCLESENIFKNEKIELNWKNNIDGIVLLEKLKDESVPIVFFDPQYRGILDKMNYGNEGKENSRQFDRCNLIQMNDEKIINFIKEIDRVLIKTGHLFLWVDKFHLCEGINNWINNSNLKIVDLIVWNKQTFGMGYRSRRTCEYLMILQKTPIKAKGVWKSRNIRDVWEEKIINKVHPHQKPIELQKVLIESVSNENNVVVDPCAGSFSVFESCKKCNRNFLGTDLNFGKFK